MHQVIFSKIEIPLRSVILIVIQILIFFEGHLCIQCVSTGTVCLINISPIPFSFCHFPTASFSKCKKTTVEMHCMRLNAGTCEMHWKLLLSDYIDSSDE